MGKIRRDRYDDDRGEKYEDHRSVKYEEDRRSVKYQDNRHENYNLKRSMSYEERHAREVFNSDNSDNENTASSTDDSESSSGSEDSRASNESIKRKRYKKRKERIKKEKYYRGSGSAESDEYEVEDQGRHRKRKKIRGEYEDGGNYIEDKRNRSRSHKRKHKHKRKHRRRRHYGSEERGSESQRDHGWGEEGERERRGRSLENVESRKEEVSRRRDDDRLDRRLEKEKRRDKRDNDRSSKRGDREDARRERRDNRRAEEEESRKRKKEYVWNPTSRWDDEEVSEKDPVAAQEEILDDPSRFIPGRQRKKSKGTVANGGNSGPQVENRRAEGQENRNSEVWGKPDENVKKEPIAEEDKEKPSLGLSGKLTEDTNTYNGVVIKYSQPSEARKPKRRWRWYIFKGDDEMPFLPLHRQSAYLIGRDRKVVDIPSDHPSCSKQHAVLQYRLVSYTRIDGTKGRTVKPYILDLESANGTFLNNKRIDGRKYYELQEKDVVKFGYSSREYVLLHEGSKDDEAEEDAGVPDLSPVSLLRQK